MDAFFASVEQLDNPELRGKPVLVGGRPPRGVVTAASYEARKYGCRSAMPSAQAEKLCPHAIFVKGNYARYGEISSQVFAIFKDFTPMVQGLSIDEAFLDVTGSLRLFGDDGSGREIAEMIRKRVASEVGLTCSVGAAPNKFLAKLASDLDKPDGLVVVGRTQAEIDALLCPLPVERLWGVGPATQKRLSRFGIKTIADLREMPETFFENSPGLTHLRNLAHGRDERRVTVSRRSKSIGHENTFGQDIGKLDELRRILLNQSEQVARRLRASGRVCKCVTLKLRHGGRYSEFVTFTRSHTLASPTDQTLQIYAAARELLEAWASRSLRPIRLMGVSLSGLLLPDEAGQLELFEDEDGKRRKRLDQALDAVINKLGKGSVRLGG